MPIKETWEQPAKIAEADVSRNEVAFLSDLEVSDLAFMPVGSDGTGYTCRHHGDLIHVSYERDTSLYTVWGDTGVKVVEGREADFRSLAAICDIFKYKISHVFAVDKNGEVGWRAGSEVRFGYSRKVNVEPVEDAVGRAASGITELQMMFGALADGAGVDDAFMLSQIRQQRLAEMLERDGM